MAARVLWLAVLAFALTGCPGGGGGGGGDDDDDTGGDGDADGDADQCVDLDGDGAGQGDGCEADDCDDTDPGTIDECGTGCEANPGRKGCPCTDGDVVACYHGPEGTGNSGGCAAGLQRCEGGVLGECDGQVLPGEEICDGEDNNCNGSTDEGVTSPCGDCNLDCEAECVGVGCDEGFDLEADGARSIVLNADGSLTLGGEVSISNFVIWVANSGQGTVSKINTRTREEEGRYRTGPAAYTDPSRTTVNAHGDVVVANRGEGSATKVLASDCVDQNGDGFDTSSGTNDILDWGEDDCVVWHLEGIPAARGSATELRAELDGGIHEYVWVASYQLWGAGGTVYEIDSEEGEFTGREIENVGGYGAAMGPNGQLWLVGLSECPTRIDTTTLDRQDYACAPEYAYGLTVDGEGRVWIGGSVARLDPETEEWESPGAEVSGGGIAVDADGNAYVGEGWGSAWKIDAETMETTSIPGAGGHGWAVDFDGNIWSIEMGDTGHVTDPETLETEDVRPPFVSSYTYSDMTGFQMVNATNPTGIYPHVFQACDGTGVHWRGLGFTADVEAGSELSFRVKTAASVEALATAEWVAVGIVPPDESPLAIDEALDRAGVDPAEYLLVEATLRSINRQNRPTLSAIEVTRSCDMVFQ
ncbi:MAG: hypothetical protein HYY06_04780 [Deltaproteobacteria bacterium]|nr:hypothetical protein [Deltaproteobacteria bacterium]